MIVDSTDKERLPIVKQELFKALGHEVNAIIQYPAYK